MSRLRHLLQGEGVNLRVHGITPEDAEKAARLYESGLTIRKVAEEIGSSFGTIQRALHENGVEMRASGICKRIE